MSDFDVIISGSGPAGLAAACLLALDERRVAVVSGPPQPDDPRTVALLMPSVRLLSHIGLWPRSLQNDVQPLRWLRLVDDTGSLLKAPEIVFNPEEIGEKVFGWNFPLALLIPALHARTRELGVSFVEGAVTGAHFEGEAISVSTNAGSFAARLAIAADGRHSPLREAAGISCNAWTYDQMALATSFAHSGPHDGMSTEYHKHAGPFTTVPLPGNRSSLVWMERPERANELMAMSDRDLAIEIQLASHGELGKISDMGPRRLFPMQGVVAREFGRQRTLLIGEAAHVVPPIGAQGLNMSLRDAAQAAELIAGAADPGSHAIIDQYDRLRRRDVAPRQQVIDFMNRSLLSRSMALESARAIGLDMISLLPPLRRVVMRQGLSPSKSLPRVMQDQGMSPDFIA